MPELPEIETLKRALSPDLTGRAIELLTVWQRALRLPIHPRLSAQLVGRSIHHVSRRGKNLVVVLDHHKGLLIHLGMSGRLRWVTAKTPREKHDHWQMRLSPHPHDASAPVLLRYNDPRRFGSLRLIPLSALETTLNLGPEPFPELSVLDSISALSPALSPALALPTWSADWLYHHTRHKNRPIKTWLMDGHNVAGIGNIYACEALFLARVHPQKSVKTLNLKTCARIVQEVNHILLQAINAGGSTLKDYRRMSGETGYFQFSFNVYDRYLQPCPVCSQPIHKITQGGRSTFYCGFCQK